MYRFDWRLRLFTVAPKYCTLRDINIQYLLPGLSSRKSRLLHVVHRPSYLSCTIVVLGVLVPDPTKSGLPGCVFFNLIDLFIVAGLVSVVS